VDEAVRKLAADSGKLRRIAGRRSGAGYVLLDLIFDHGRLRLTADADTDEIVVRVDASAESHAGEIADDDVLAPLIGKQIELAWTMVNDRGYRDAFQIRCLDLESRAVSCCQFEAGAAAIRVARVTV
jgi:hypothetical protein